MADSKGKRWISPAQAARLLGVHRSTVTRAIAAGRLTVHRCQDGRLLLDSEMFRSEWAANTHPGLVTDRLADKSTSWRHWDDCPDGFTWSAELPDFSESRARVEHYRAQLLALELEERRASLMDAEEVRAAAAQVRDQLREHLAALADRLTPLIAAESDPAAVHALLSNGVRDCLLEFCDVLAVGRGPVGPAGLQWTEW